MAQLTEKKADRATIKKRRRNNVKVLVNPHISPEELFSFYERSNICEQALGMEVASRVLDHSSCIVAAFEDDRLVGIARAMFDGLSATVMEFSVDLEYQGDGLRHNNGSLVEKDASNVGKKMGKVLLDELNRIGATFITAYIVGGCEERFYRAIGFRPNTGHKAYYIDKRPYVLE
ncbi:MAG: hypothetical protein HY677_02560 [Chloroflexi bacterium]|nr:hypothetical protein [Chloroflexota bacterium]